jgi:hypothetical protein
LYSAGGDKALTGTVELPKKHLSADQNSESPLYQLSCFDNLYLLNPASMAAIPPLNKKKRQADWSEFTVVQERASLLLK